jgi:hypothetical protein
MHEHGSAPDRRTGVFMLGDHRSRWPRSRLAGDVSRDEEMGGVEELYNRLDNYD